MSAQFASFINPSSANSAHFAGGQCAMTTNTTSAGGLLLVDFLFGVFYPSSTTTTVSVTGTFSRYQSTTATDQDYIGGTFCIMGGNSAGGAHNWTVCQYTNQAGNTAQSFPSFTGMTSATTGIDSSSQWFMPFASGDSGVKALTQMQCSASIAATFAWYVAHPIAFLPTLAASFLQRVDAINSAFNLTKIFDNACLGFIVLPKNNTAATTYSGAITIVSE
jgi:hypothetical protein